MARPDELGQDRLGRAVPAPHGARHPWALLSYATLLEGLTRLVTAGVAELAAWLDEQAGVPPGSGLAVDPRLGRCLPATARSNAAAVQQWWKHDALVCLHSYLGTGVREQLTLAVLTWDFAESASYADHLKRLSFAHEVGLEDMAFCVGLVKDGRWSASGFGHAQKLPDWHLGGDFA